LSDVPEPSYRGILIAVAMFITALCQTMFLHQYFQRCFMTGMRLRAALVTAIYQKTLVLSNASRQDSTVGEVEYIRFNCFFFLIYNILTKYLDC
jgi:hypothetical protein